MTHNQSIPSAPWQALNKCVEHLYRGPWQIFQLRGQPLGSECIDADDVDLLVSRQSVDCLLDAAYQWVKDGDCHLRVNSRRSDKVELSLFSRDGLHYITFDLWINLWQLDGGNQRLTFSDCAGLFDEGGRSVQALPIDLEACLYVQHLLAKRRVIGSERTQKKLQFYVQQCQQAGFEETCAIVDDICRQQEVSTQQCLQTLNYIASQLPLVSTSTYGRAIGKLKTHVWQARLAAPRKTRLISIMGCDGAGKTTLAHALKKKMPMINAVFTGKHLYRKSFIHKAAVIFVRPLLFQSRENFDEKLAPLVYLRACLGQRIRYWRQKNGITLIDRSIIDFIYLNRKTDQPTFSYFSFLARLWGKRIPTIHCLVSYEIVSTRKLEMTKAGHEKYNNDMYQFFTRRSPTDYLAFNNEMSVAESTAALEKIIPMLSVRHG